MNQNIVDAINSQVTEAAVQQLMLELVAAPSPQTDLLEAEPQVIEFIAKEVEPRLRSYGVTDIDYDSMGNLVARIGKNANGKRLLFVTHAMNHPAASMPDPYVGKLVDGKDHGLPGKAIIGRGLCEQKAGMAAMLTAVKAVCAAGIELEGELLFVTCTSGETGKHDALRSIISEKKLTADLGLIDGSSLTIRLGNRGRLDMFLTVVGEVSHSGSPRLGANAISGAMEVLSRINEQATLPEPHPQLGECTLTCTHIRSFPDATHTLQGRCELTLDRRLLPGEDPEKVFEEIREIARTVESVPDPVSGKPYRIEVEMGPFMYPSLVDEDSEVVKLVTRSSEEMHGVAPKLIFGKSAFDQGYLNHIGIQTVNYGPGEDQFAHTDLDMASVERTCDGAKTMAMMICNHLVAQ